MELKMANPVVAMAVAATATSSFALAVLYLKWKKKKNEYEKLVPRAVFNQYGKLKELECFGDYVVRQLGLDGDGSIAQTVAKAAEGYLRDDRNVSSESSEIACVLVSGLTQEEDQKQICEEILQELEICVVAYFSFHWKHASSVVEKVVRAGATMKRLHHAVLTALRKQRYDKVLKSLSAKRRFHTLIELKRIASVPVDGGVTVAAESSKRCPVILFIGGGMGAGKSTVVKSIFSSSFWAGVVQDAVVVEADAFKETDVIYRTLSSMSRDDVAGNAELVHQYSTEAANSLLVSALNEGRDVIFDGTMSWEPFVLQTIAMVRDIHNRRYRMGPGYKLNEDGTETEKYWEPQADDDECVVANKAKDEGGEKRPYRIEFVGVTCDAHLAVVRGMRRAIATKRGVPVKGQLRSHKMFAKSIEKYMSVVDASSIYSTSTWKGPAERIAVKDGSEKLLIDPRTYPGVRCLGDLNTHSGSVIELYNEHTDRKFVNQFWQDVILDPKRKQRLERLREAILANAATSELLERSPSQLSDNGVTTQGLIAELQTRKNKSKALVASGASTSAVFSSGASSSAISSGGSSSSGTPRNAMPDLGAPGSG